MRKRDNTASKGLLYTSLESIGNMNGSRILSFLLHEKLCNESLFFLQISNRGTGSLFIKLGLIASNVYPVVHSKALWN